MTEPLDGQDAITTLDGVIKKFRVGHSSQVAVAGVSMVLGSETALGVVGESGSGKSTLARMIAGLEHPTAGQVLFRGTPVAEVLRNRAYRRRYRREVQLVAQDTTGSFDPRWTLRRAIGFPLRVLEDSSSRTADKRVDEVLELLGVDPGIANRRPFEVSGGQRQRCAIARALVLRPKLLVCDEVVSALDVSIQGHVLNILRQYCYENKAGLVFVSHGLPATAFISDEIAVMRNGSIVEQRPATTLLSAPEHPYTAELIEAHRFTAVA